MIFNFNYCFHCSQITWSFLFYALITQLHNALYLTTMEEYYVCSHISFAPISVNFLQIFNYFSFVHIGRVLRSSWPCYQELA